MRWFHIRKKPVVNAEQLRRVVNLIPEYVDALIDERRTRTASLNGLDARETHGPAERKLKKVEARIAELLGSEPRNTQKTRNGLSGAECRRIFLDVISRKGVKAQRGNIVLGDCAGHDLIKAPDSAPYSATYRERP